MNPTSQRLEVECGDAIRILGVEGEPVDGLPAVAGLYTFSARRPGAVGELGLKELEPDMPLTRRILYIGKSESSLADRLGGTHFATGMSGHSTVRRTFGSLLGLRAIPRPSAIADPTRKQLMTMTANFAFDHDDDVRLTQWMLSNLAIRAFPSSFTPLAALERRVGAAFRPPLDQERKAFWTPNPWRDQVHDARARLRTLLRIELGL